MISKTLYCSATGNVRGKISFHSGELEKAIEAAIEGRDKLGLTISYINRGSISEQWFEIELRKTESPEHFPCLAAEAKKLGWN